MEFPAGTKVRLKESKKVDGMCPEGREDNDSAHIEAHYPSIGEGVVKLDRDLHGCRWWNITDLDKDET